MASGESLAPTTSYLPLLEAFMATAGDERQAGLATGLPRKTRDDLEWPQLLSELAGHCETDEGKRLAEQLCLLRSGTLVERRLREVEEAANLTAEGVFPSIYGTDVIADQVEYAARGGTLDGLQLLAVARVAKISHEVARFFASRRDQSPLLAEVGADLRSAIWLWERVSRVIDVDGQILDQASSELSELRERVRRCRERLRQRVDGYLKKEGYEDYLQDRFFTIREGRFVLPVRVSERRNVPGIVHGYSGSGQSVFIEPTELVDLNNQLRLAEIEVEAEEQRILKELSEEVAQCGEALKANAERLFYLDLTQAAGSLAREMRATRPRLSTSHRVNLSNARHPLLSLRQARVAEGFTVVGSDIRFGYRTRQEDPVADDRQRHRDRIRADGGQSSGETAIDVADDRQRHRDRNGAFGGQSPGEMAIDRARASGPVEVGTATGKRKALGLAAWASRNGGEAAGEGPVLVISGPNTGGKTVTLKTVGLCALMVNAGLLIPVADDSEIPLFAQIFSDVGDEQSLEENLSSFSAHLTHINRILNRADEYTLILLDELFGGTDPAQGAALAIGVLEHLAVLGALVVATTHFETLKRFALSADRFLCASMGFDLASLSPTFKLQPGIPGASYALGIARRLGFPGPILERAQALMEGEDQTDLEAILTELDDYRSRLDHREAEARRAQDKAERSHREYVAELERLRKEALEAVDHNLSRVFEEIRQAQILVRRRRRELSAPPEVQTAEQVEAIQQDLTRVKEQLEEQRKERRRAETAQVRRPLEAGEVKPERVVYVMPFVRTGHVLQVEVARGQAMVQIGGMKVTVRLNELFEPNEDDATDEQPSRKHESARAGEPGGAAQEQHPPLSAPDPSSWLGPQTSANTVDLRGMRVEEALEHLDRMLDSAFKRHEPGLYVIHGHGTGALKAAVRDALPRSAYVRAIRPGERNEGGDGVTVTWLRID